MFIYKLTNNFNGMSYIGQTIGTVSARIRGHKSLKNNKCPYLKNAINKYGFENFKIETLAETEDRVLLDQLEIKFIKEHNTLFPNGYNLKSGGQSGGPLNEESKKKLSISNTGRKMSDEAKEKLSLINSGINHPQYGIKKTKQTRDKISKALSGDRNSRFGIPRSDDVKSKISKKAKLRGFAGIEKAIDSCRKPIICIENNKNYISIIEASKDLKISRCSIRLILQGKKVSINGLSFKYMDSK